jgi:hypothetical protein
MLCKKIMSGAKGPNTIDKERAKRWHQERVQSNRQDAHE